MVLLCGACSDLDLRVTVHDVAHALPGIPELRDRSRALAMLDAVLCPEWESRYYSFNAQWAPGEELASMRNGSGDAYSIVFSAAGAFIRGFDHESPMSPLASGRNQVWPGVVDSLPGVFAGYVTEPAFSVEGMLEATVCLWRQTDDDRWHVGVIDFPAGADPDGAVGLFAVLMDGSPEAYRRFAEEYYEQSIDIDAIAQVYQLRPLTDELLRRLNPDVSLADLEEDVTGIAYPSGGDTTSPGDHARIGGQLRPPPPSATFWLPNRPNLEI